MPLKKEVLHGFKNLHRISRTVFCGDEFALNAVRTRINDEYKKNKYIENEESVQEMIKFAKEVENELRTTVVQAKKTDHGVYELKMTEETAKLDNVMYDDNAVIDKPRSPSQRCKK